MSAIHLRLRGTEQRNQNEFPFSRLIQQNLPPHATTINNKHKYYTASSARETRRFSIVFETTSSTHRAHWLVGKPAPLTWEGNVLTKSRSVAERTEVDMFLGIGSCSVATRTDHRAVEVDSLSSYSLVQSLERHRIRQHDGGSASQKPRCEWRFKSVVLCSQIHTKTYGRKWPKSKRLICVLVQLLWFTVCLAINLKPHSHFSPT